MASPTDPHSKPPQAPPDKAGPINVPLTRGILFDSAVRRRISDYRAARNFTCAQLDRKAGLPEGTSEGVEDAKIDISAGLLTRIAMTFEIPPADLLTQAERDVSQEEENGLDIESLLAAFSRIDAPTRRELLELIHRLAEDGGRY